MFLSIVVAVYNIENYLEKCLESLVACRIDDVELILAIGDSNDRSNDICKEYEKKYNNIIVLEQSGKGLSNARNCGMDIVNGEFVMFVDGDDCILSNEFEKTIKKLKSFDQKQVDVIVSDYYMVNESDEIVSRIFQIEETSEPIYEYKYIEQFMSRYKAFWNVWRYIYRKDFLTSNGIVFKENFLSEDIDYTTNVFMKAKKILYYHNPYYCYRVGRKNSLMNVVSIKRVYDTITIIKNSVGYILQDEKFEYKELMVKKFLFEYILNIATIYEVPQKDRTRAKDIFNDSICLLDEDFYSFGKFIYKLNVITGIEPIAFALLFMKKIKRLIRKIRI